MGSLVLEICIRETLLALLVKSEEIKPGLARNLVVFLHGLLLQFAYTKFKELHFVVLVELLAMINENLDELVFRRLFSFEDFA